MPRQLERRVVMIVTVMVAMALACLALSPATAQDAEVEKGLVGWWRFDGLVDGKVPELTGNGSPAELAGACAGDFDPARGVHIPPGQGEGAVDGYARTKDLPFLRGEPTELTVTAWVWWDGRGGGDAVYCPGRFVLGLSLWEVHYEQKPQKGWSTLQPGIEAPSRRWVHLAGVLDKERITFYRDGELAGTTSVPKPLIGGSSDLDIGRGFGALHRQMPGYIREVRLYDRPLSADEITKLASVRRPATPADLPARGLYVPGRVRDIACAFTEPDCASFVADTTRQITLADDDVAELSMAGCGIYERVDPSVWRETGGLMVSGEASASAPVRARLVFVGWPKGAELRSSLLLIRSCGAPLDLEPKDTAFQAVVAVPKSVESGIVIFAVADRRDDPASLIGTTIKLDKLQYAAAGADVEAAASSDAAATVSSGDGLTLGLDRHGAVTGVESRQADLAGSGVLPMSGWFVTDLAADKLPIPLVGAVRATANGLMFSGVSEKLKLKYRMEVRGSAPYLDCQAHLEDLSGQDRALMLEFRLPLSSEQSWTWHDGGYERREVQPGRRYQMVSGVLTGGGQRKVSIYPFASLGGRNTAMCLGVPLMKEPRLFRLFAYRPFIGDAVLGCEFEVGLSPVTKHFPSKASYRFVIYSTEQSWPFRRAVEKYYQFFPEQFTSIVKRHGNWSVLRMTQQYTPNLADFAIVVDETVMGSPPADMYGSVADKLLGIANCPYVRPGTFAREFEGDPSDPDGYQKRMALLAHDEKLPEHTYMFLNAYWGTTLPTLVRATRNSGMHDAEGRLIWRWPSVRREGKYFMRCQQDCSYEVPAPNWASVIRNQYTLADDWSRAAGVPLGGVYFDNMGGTSINALDFRRDHWEIARMPLLVNADPPQPVQSKVLQLCEFFARFAPEVHRRGGLLIGNFSNPVAFALAQYFDFIGVEGYKGALIERARVMAGPKPASYLPIARVTRDMFENCLSYAVAPGMVRSSARELYREFMPLIVSLSEAGWQPVPQARYTPSSGSQPDAVVERFGSFESGNLSFTVRLLEQDAPEGVLSVYTRGARIPDRDVVVVDVRRNLAIEPRWERSQLLIPLPLVAGRTEVVRICRRADWERHLAEGVADALERAGREWAWVKAQHDDTLTARTGFEEDKGRWYRYGFEEAKVSLSPDAYSGKSALLIEAAAPTGGTIKTEPFSTKWELKHRITFHYRTEATGEVNATVVFRPSWFGGERIGETEPFEVALEGSSGDGWRRFETVVQPVKDARRTYLQLDFSSFRGRFAMDEVTFCPVVEPLTETPAFGFAELSTQLKTSVERGEGTQTATLIKQIPGRVETWRAAAARLPDGDAQRMAYEIAVIQDAVKLCQKPFP